MPAPWVSPVAVESVQARAEQGELRVYDSFGRFLFAWKPGTRIVAAAVLGYNAGYDEGQRVGRELAQRAMRQALGMEPGERARE